VAALAQNGVHVVTRDIHVGECLVLSLFPGIGLLDMAFEQEGFCVVRGPDCLWGGDVRRFHPPAGKFDGVIGGPPCQAFSTLSHMVRHNGYEPKFGNLIPEFERCINEAAPTWFVMEEVPAAPVPAVDGYEVHDFLLNNRQLGEKQSRTRRWSFGHRGERRILGVETVVFEHPEFEYAATGGGGSCARKPSIAIGGSGKRKKQPMGTMGYRSEAAIPKLCEQQGLPVDFDLPGFTMRAKLQAVGNGVPLPMGRAIAKAVREAIA
jgi:DNA (cytosine-5)-methyltransferase 1